MGIQVRTHHLRKGQAQVMMMTMKVKHLGLKATNTTQEEVISIKDNSIQVASLVQLSSRTHLSSSRIPPSQHIRPSLPISFSIRMGNTSSSGSNSKQTWPGIKTGVLLFSFKGSRLNGRPTGQSLQGSHENSILVTMPQ